MKVSDSQVQLLEQVSKYFKQKVVKVTQIKKEGTALYNLVIKIELSDGTKLFGKIYTHDKWERLERESEAITFLNKSKYIKVPQLYFSDKKGYFAVYSLEEGKKILPKNLNKDEIFLIVQIASSLHSFEPTKKVLKILPRSSGRACFKLSDHLVNFRGKMAEFEGYYQKLKPNDSFKKRVDELGILKRTDSAIQKIVKSHRDNLNKEIPFSQRRFNQGDFTVDNFIFQKRERKTQICLTDFEYCGWDDPLRMIADFVIHDRNLSVNETLKTLLIDEYFKLRGLKGELRERLETIKVLMGIEWIAIYLRLLVPSSLKVRASTTADFDKEKFINEKLQKAIDRINILEST